MGLKEQLTTALADRYRIEAEIGAGGMATVFLAYDPKHSRQVAIKVLKADLAAAIGPERFLREIEIAAGLNHPHILPLHDSGEADGLLYYVMPFVEGESLQDRLDREGRLPLADAVQVAAEVAGALAFAHERGVIHRDVKPANILFQAGHAVLADFGIAQAASKRDDPRMTDAGVSLGTPVYMSPEQAVGDDEVDGRTDIYALGCTLYEMLGGEVPFGGPSTEVVRRKLVGNYRPLKEICPEVPAEIDKAVSRALEQDPGDRFATAEELREALLQGLPTPGARKRMLIMAGVALVVVVAAGVAVVQNRAESRRRVLVAEKLAEVERLVEGGSLEEALAVADEVEALSPGDTTLARLYPRFTFTVPIHTDPPGATVYMQDWGEEAGEWELLGVTPLEEVRLAGTVFEIEAAGYNPLEDVPHRFRFEMEGYETWEFLGAALIGSEENEWPPLDPVVLQPLGTEMEGMVRLPGWPDTRPPWNHGAFFMDRYETTNREYKAFVDAGGYGTPEHWEHPFILDGQELGFEEAMALLVDETGRAGPSTWRLGTYPEGEADYPVGGVSWYEAAAYARWVGKELPLWSHWNFAYRYIWETSRAVLPRSNLESDGPRPVAEREAMVALGLYDLVGNVREWCFNPGGEGERITRGGAWMDAPFLTGYAISKSAFSRDPANGVRLVRTFETDETLDPRRGRVDPTAPGRDYGTEVPVSDAEFEVFKRMYAYDPLPLNPVVERTDTFDYWVREKVVFAPPSGEGGGVVLYLPKDMQGPFQPLLYFGGTEIISMTSIEEQQVGAFGFLPRAGRAVAVPLYKGTYGRQAELPPESNFPGGFPSNTYRDATITWVQELGRVIDYLETRPDMDADRVGYYGFSHGGLVAPIILAVEPRIKAGVVNVGGLPDRWRFQPEIDPINFVTRVRTPTLMVNGRYDVVFPYETAQLPMYELLGTEDKDHYVAESGHIVPKDDLIRETLAWYDKYLGPVGGG